MSARLTRSTGAALAGLLVTALLTATGPAALSAPSRLQARAGEPVPFTIGTYNIQASRDLDDFKKAVKAFKPKVDVAGLQEIAGHVRNNWLMSDRSWRIFRGETVGQVSVIWNPDVFDFVSGREVKLADGAKVDGNHGKPVWKDADHAPLVRLRHVETGRVISVMSVHLLHGAINRGRPDKSKPRSVKYYVEQVDSLRAIVAAEMPEVDEVFVTGDFNIGFEADRHEKYRAFPYHRFTKLGLTNMWEDTELKPHGTHIDTHCGRGQKQCGAYLDQIWTGSDSLRSKVLTKIRRSDHYPATAVYELVKPVGYVPPQGSAGFVDTLLEDCEWDKPWQVRKDGPLRFHLAGDFRHGYVGKVQVVSADVDGAAEGEDFTVDDSSLFDNDLEHNHVDVLRIPDTAHEADESFVLRLVDPHRTDITVAEATGVLWDDDTEDNRNRCPRP